MVPASPFVVELAAIVEFLTVRVVGGLLMFPMVMVPASVGWFALMVALSMVRVLVAFILI